MDIYATPTMGERIKGNPYVGRGIVIGKTADGKKAAVAYFIMGRSANSRNRVFVERDGALFTEPFDASLVEDPSLIIYAAIRRYKNRLIVTNGDQTDTVYQLMKSGATFEEALNTRAFEPDAPNLTPRISGCLTFKEDDFSYKMSILKSADAEGTACNRYNFSYVALPGVGHFIHTYVTDGNPIPTFQGEPERVGIGNDLTAFATDIWENLNEENKISLVARFIDLESGDEEQVLINKNQ
ncbi:MAG: IMP cyclohydrolase [Clostridia bacterium]|nr:IMP cyclohydrolase [Clostridia bacterium]